MIRRGLRQMALVALCALPACEVVGGFEGFQGGEKAAGHPCDVLDEWMIDEDRDVPLVRVNLQGGSCVWVDKYEVTVGKYEEWLKSTAAPRFVPDRCDWKVGASNPSGDPTDACRSTITEKDPWNQHKPIRCVDWCDAAAYCQSFKDTDLCSVREVSLFPYDAADQWVSACSESFAFSHPYGSAAQDGACNLDNAADCGSACGLTIVGLKKGCFTPSGIADMLGNVREWAYQCRDPQDNTQNYCRVVGGSYADSFDKVSCIGWGTTLTIDARDAQTGFRCCRKPDAGELQ